MRDGQIAGDVGGRVSSPLAGRSDGWAGRDGGVCIGLVAVNLMPEGQRRPADRTALGARGEATMTNTTTMRPTVPSARLVQVMRTYCLGLEGRALRDLRHSVAAGHYPWLRAELGAALAQDAFSVADWATFVGSSPDGRDGELRVMRRQQQQVWRVVFPDDSYPGSLPPGM